MHFVIFRFNLKMFYNYMEFSNQVNLLSLSLVVILQIEFSKDLGE
jgi:hypothetical protein